MANQNINRREFISRGGFVLMDDFDGPDQWYQMRSQILRAFPNNDFVEVPLRPRDPRAWYQGTCASASSAST